MLHAAVEVSGASWLLMISSRDHIEVWLSLSRNASDDPDWMKMPRLCNVLALVAMLTMTMIHEVPSARAAVDETCSAAAIAVPTTPVAPPTPEKYQHFVDASRRVSPAAHTVLIGDSLAQAWPQTMAERTFGGSVVNLAQGGDRTQDTIWRLNNLDLASMNPSEVVILVGTNNLGEQPCAILAGIREITKIVEKYWKTARITLLQIPPRGGIFEYHGDERLALNIMIADLAKKNGFRTANFDGPLMCIGQTDSPFYQKDHIHFNAAGYELISNVIAETK